MDAPEIIERGRDKRFALLIDADNVSAKYIKPILNELNKYGTVTYKRIYGDWTLSLHAKWKDALLENSITPIQQFSYTYGKNSTDSAMIIDAMDILYGGGVDGFCIVSSDSDFTRLASRLRESGRTVIGMGEKKTPTPFRKACDIFTVLELLVKDERREKANGPTMSKSEVEQAVVDIIIDNQNNGKATGLGEIGSRLQKRYPDFDVRNYGTNLLSKLLSEFTRVKITKDHSSVAVELADASDAEKAQSAAPTAAAAAEAPQAEISTDEAIASNGVADSSTEAEADAENENRKPSRRSRRSRKIKANRDSETSEEASAEAAHGEAQPAANATEEGTSNAVSAAEDATGAAGTDEPAEAPTTSEKPARKPRRRRKAAAARTESEATAGQPNELTAEPATAPSEAEIETGTAPIEEPAPEAAKAETIAETPTEPATKPADEETPTEPTAKKPARKPRRRKKANVENAEATSNANVAEEAPSDVVASVEATPSVTATVEAPSDVVATEESPKAEASPTSFIREAIAAAGNEGIALTQLGEDIRAAFKDFKVRDLGFPQLRLYIASVEDFELIKDDKAFRAKLR
ncbi:MAG: NYN domain-containing protein [Eggerthellaceae bacterium]|nr:NYN domain-containing protein [Eggerthellaceae bacterium]